jgi:hypothetical protein
MFFQPKRKTNQSHPTVDLMNNVVLFAPAAGTYSDSGPGLYSDHMLAELLALQEGMIADLRLERLRVADIAESLAEMIDYYLAGVIDQHEKAAAMLRPRSKNRPPATATVGPIVATREDGSAVEFFPAPRLV